MAEWLSDAARNIDLAPVRELKAAGRRVIGYTCSFVPVEVFHAAGLLPVRLRGIQTERLDIADAYYGPFICTFPKAVLQQAGSGSYDFLDGAVVTNGCDAMRRLDECWRKMGSDIPGRLPPWLYYFDVPHKPHGVAFEWYQKQVRKLIRALSKGFGVTITDAALKEAIETQNRVRQALEEMDRLRCREPARLSGSDAYAALIARNVLPTELFWEELRGLIQTAAASTAPIDPGRRRLFVAGSICDDLELVSRIEAAGAVVVGESVCYGLRNYGERVALDGDPIEALTTYYLSGSMCPRMFGFYKQRRDAITAQIRRSRAQGVILQNIRFCDLHGSANGLLERDLEELGIPTLRIEKEYGALTDRGRLKMRIDAFLEQLENG